ncbi:MAG: discoidin domain-containing protein [Acidimicrobiales bacterium]
MEDETGSVFGEQHRRDVLKKIGIGGAVAWTAPVVGTFAVKAAAASGGPQPPVIRNLSVNPTNNPAGPTATMSSQYIYNDPGCSGANLGNDGNTNQNWQFACTTGNLINSIFHTDTGPGEWWQVDLKATYTITSITVYNRLDNGADVRAQSLSVTFDGGSSTPIPGTTGNWSVATLTLGSPIAAQVIRVTNGTNNYFHLAEVQVFGY